MTSQRVFISYCSQEPDASLAQKLHEGLVVAGHQSFLAAKSICWGENWVERIERELKQCDYFLLLLSEQSASSDMVVGEVRIVKRLRDKLNKPVILPIRVNLPDKISFNYELESFLSPIQQLQWGAEADTSRVLSVILAFLSPGATAMADLIQPATYKLTERQRRHLRQQLKEQQQEYNDRSEEIEFLSNSEKIDDLRPKERLRLQRQILAAKQKRDEVVQRLKELEKKLNL